MASFPFPVQANSGDGMKGGAGESLEEEEEKNIFIVILFMIHIVRLFMM